MKNGMCAGGKHCLAPQPCGKIIVDHREYLGILRRPVSYTHLDVYKRQIYWRQALCCAQREGMPSIA